MNEEAPAKRFEITEELIDIILTLDYEGYKPKEIVEMLSLPISYKKCAQIIEDYK